MQINVGEDEEKLLKYEHVILDQHDIENSSYNDNRNWLICKRLWVEYFSSLRQLHYGLQPLEMVTWSTIVHQNDQSLTNVSCKELFLIKLFSISSHANRRPNN
jgi:hypothetical protein